ncbi:glycosyl transferase family 1 [Aeromonas hydrophila]|uniref:glycosyltransferase n=1 Tax=Aeromonas hydrophila TaxID=644 RepID=UPI0015DC1A05|nr:glycosyltransferase [Aeromonas hydrophila]BBT05955.1 glycosyl transferase family 1 [Aeromonas hydrophila]
MGIDRNDRRIKVARVSTVPFFVKTQLYNQILDLKNYGFDVTVITSKDNLIDKEFYSSDVFNYKEINISRKISIIDDIVSVIRLWLFFRKNRFDIVHSTTPKAGLLCALSAFLARVPIRLHTFTGQPWQNMTGMSRQILKFFDRMIVVLCTRCYADSHSQARALVSEGVYGIKDVHVIGKGSLAGVDLERFNITKYSSAFKSTLRKNTLLAESAFVILFIGRVNIDKGINELLCAFKYLQLNKHNVELVIVGPLDEGMMAEDYLKKSSIPEEMHKKIHFMGFSPEPEKYMSIGDVFCIPSYREGFGTVVIEAAAMGLPSVASDIYGLSDAIVDGETGLLVKVRDCTLLSEKLEYLIRHRDILESMSEKAMIRVKSEYSSKVISDGLISDYLKLLKESA